MRSNTKINKFITGWKIPPLLVAFCLVASPQLVFAVVEGVFQAPAIDTYISRGESEGDGDGDGVNETRIKRYMNKKGDRVFSMASGEKVWAWSLNTIGSDDGDLNKNYVIRDSNCDGIFDEKYGLQEEFHVPECLNKN